MTELIESIVKDILTVCVPQRVILYAEKRTMATGKLKSLSLCVIVPDGEDCRALRTRLYLAIAIDVPVNLNVYQVGEWEELNVYPGSYASWIARKGQVVYEPQT